MTGTNKSTKSKRGSLTKEAVGMELFIPDMKSYEPTLNIEVYGKGLEYVNWGESNKYPEYIWDIYSNCGVLQSIINGCAEFTTGRGIVNNTGIDEDNEFGDSIQDVVEKLVLDRWVFGGCAVQIKFNELGTPIALAHIDFRKCRVSEDECFVFVHDGWHKSWGTNRYDKFNAYNPDTCASDGVQIYYYKGTKTRGIYPITDYSASLVSAEILIKTDIFNYDELDNNFMGSGIINFNNGSPRPEDRIKIEKGINDKFCGVRNKGNRNTARPIISFNLDKDHATTYDRMQTDNLPDRYNNTYEKAVTSVFISLRAHPILFGFALPTGFADMNFDDAFDLLNETHIQKKQNEFNRIFTRIFGSSDAIQLLPFETRSVETEKEVDPIELIPDNLLSDLSVDERRALIGYPALDTVKEEEKPILADTIGVGGTEALVSIMQNSEISDTSKRGLLTVLFGLNDEQINLIFGNGQNGTTN